MNDEEVVVMNLRRMIDLQYTQEEESIGPNDQL